MGVRRSFATFDLGIPFTGAVETQDVPLIMGVLVMLGVIGVVFRVVVDVVIAYLDPRQRQGTA